MVSYPSEDKKAFESRVVENQMLRDAVNEQKSIHEAAKRSYQRQQIKQIGRRYHFRKNLLRGGLSLLVIGILAATCVFVLNQFEEEREIPLISDELRESLNRNAPMDLPTQYYVIPEDGGVVLSEQGVLISVPEEAFTFKGQPYNKPVALQFQEALKGSDIFKSGLSTTTNGRLLETGGMISVTGYTMDGEPLDFNEKVGVYVQVPTNDSRTDMQLYDGERLADGSINWVNPEKLEKIPVPVPMADLDFYPAGYEDYLDEQKWKRSKESRDSLYLSFEEEDEGKAFVSGEKLFKQKCATCHHPTKDGTGPALAGVRDLYQENGADDMDVIQFVKNWQVAAEFNEFAKSRTYLSPTAMTQFGESLTNNEIIRILDYVDEVAGVNYISSNYDLPVIPARKLTLEEQNYLYGNNQPNDQNMTFEEYVHLVQWKENPRYSELVGSILAQGDEGVSDTISLDDLGENYAAASEGSEACTYILPSNVLAIWNAKFNKTNLSTREFERRMQAIHQSCNNDILDVYTTNLDKSLNYCDKKVVAMGHTQFSQFAAENVGKLKAGNPHVQQLEKYYKKSIKRLQERNKVLQKEEKKRRFDHDAKTRTSRFDEMDRSTKRETQAYNEEFNYNLDNVYKQLGRTRGFTIRSASAGVATPSARSAVKNIDRLVAEATSKRETTTIVDPETGKKAELKYNDFSFKVKNPDQYIKLFAYVMPYELNSYQRISGKDGKFNHPLNNDIRYNIAVVGIKENGFGYFQKLNIKGGELGTVKLNEISEARLDANVKQLNRNRNTTPMPITNELNWLYQEQKDYKEQKIRQQMSAFREDIRCIIFPCCSGEQQGQGQADNEEGSDEEIIVDIGL